MIIQGTRKGGLNKMGLFINNEKHPDVYKNNGQVLESNQRFYKTNSQAEMLEEQLRMNETLQRSFNELKDTVEIQATKQANQWKNFGNRLYELKKGNLQHKNTENLVMEALKKLDEKNTQLQVTMENERLGKQQVIDQINYLSHSNQEFVEQLDKLVLATDLLDIKVDEQLDLQKQIAQQMLKQDDTHQEVLKRLDNQEALTEKILRQVDHFRSILFERTNYLAEKIEKGYHLTSSYFTNLVTSSDKPKTHYLIKQKQKEEQTGLEKTGKENQ